MGKLDELKKVKFGDILSCTNIDDRISGLQEKDKDLKNTVENIKNDIAILKQEANNGQIKSNLDGITSIDISKKEKRALVEELDKLEKLLDQAMRGEQKGVIAKSQEEVSQLQKEVGEIPEFTGKLEEGTIMQLRDYIQSLEKQIVKDPNNNKLKEKLEYAKKILSKKEKQIKDREFDENVTKEVLQSINNKTIDELILYIQSLKKDIGDDTLKFEIGGKKQILAEAESALGKKLIEKPDAIDILKLNYPKESIIKAIFAYLTQDRLFAKRYKQAYDATSVVDESGTWTEKDKESIKRFEIFKISVNHEHTNITQDTLDDIFKNKLGLSTTQIGETLGVHLKLGEKLDRLEKEHPGLMEDIGKHGALGVLQTLINKTNMGRGHRGAAMMFAELAAIGSVLYGIFKTIDKLGFFKGIGALLLGEFTASAITGHGAFDLVGRLIYGGLDEVDLSGSSKKTRKSYKELAGDKEKKQQLGNSLLMSMVLGEDMKISDVKKYSELKNGKLVFKINDFLETLDKDDWRRDFLKNILNKVDESKVSASFADGLEKIGFNATTYNTIKGDTTIGALFEEKRKEDEDKKKIALAKTKTSSKGTGNSSQPKNSSPKNTAPKEASQVATGGKQSKKAQTYTGGEQSKQGTSKETQTLVANLRTLGKKDDNKTSTGEKNKKGQEKISSTVQIGYIENGRNYIIGQNGKAKEIDLSVINPKLNETLENLGLLSQEINDLLFLLQALVRYDKKTYSSYLIDFQKQIDIDLTSLSQKKLESIFTKLKTKTEDTLSKVAGDKTELQKLLYDFDNPNIAGKTRRNRIYNYIRDVLENSEYVKMDIIDRKFSDYTDIDNQTVLNLLESLYTTDENILLSTIYNSKKGDIYYSIKKLYGDKKNIEVFIEKLKDKSEESDKYILEMKDKVLEEATKKYPNNNEERKKYIEAVEEEIKGRFLILYTKNLLMTSKLEKESAWDKYRGSDNDLKLLADIEGVGWLDMKDSNKFWAKEALLLIATEALAFAAGGLTFGVGTGVVNTAVYGTRGVKFLKYAYETGKYADRAFVGASRLEKIGIGSARTARYLGESIVGGTSFYAGMGGVQSLLEGKNMYTKEGLFQSIVLIGVFKALEKLYILKGWQIDYSKPFSQKKKFVSQFLLEGSVLSAIGLGNDGILFEPGEWTLETILQAFVMAAFLKASGGLIGKYKFKIDGKKIIVEKKVVESIDELLTKKSNLVRKRSELIKENRELRKKKRLTENGKETSKIDKNIQKNKNRIKKIGNEIGLVEQKINNTSIQSSNLSQDKPEVNNKSQKDTGSELPKKSGETYNNFAKDIRNKLPKKSGETVELYKNGDHTISIRNLDGKYNLVLKKDGTTTSLEFKTQKQLANHLKKNLDSGDFRLLVESNYQKVLNEKIDTYLEGKGAKFKMGGKEYRIRKVGDKKVLQIKDGKNKWKEENLDDFLDANYESIVDNYLKGMELIIKKKGLWNKKISTKQNGTTPTEVDTSKWGRVKNWTYGDLLKWMRILKSDASLKEKAKVSMKKIFFGNTERITTSGKIGWVLFGGGILADSILKGEYEDSELLGTFLDETFYSNLGELFLYNVFPIAPIGYEVYDHYTDKTPSTGGQTDL